MIIARAPLRVSFAGGGTDIPSFYRRFGPGCVLSSAINRYVYVSIDEKFDGRVSLRYRIHENVDSVKDLKHALVREILLEYGIESGVEIVISSEVPARGSGLGASSSIAVALCLALEVYAKNGAVLKSYLAEKASRIEIENVGSPIGKQDHYASVMGGVRFYQFMDDESVTVESFDPSEFLSEIEAQSMLFYIDSGHSYHGSGFVQKILKEQSETVEKNIRGYILNRDNAKNMRDHMPYEVIERFMDHINENWRIKKTLHSEISSDYIDEIMRTAFKEGISAAKLCGAGGGGFLYFLCQPDMQDRVRRAMSKNMTELKFGIDWEGAKIVYDSGRRAFNHARV